MRKQVIQILRTTGLYSTAKASEAGVARLWRSSLNYLLPHEAILVYHRIADVSCDPHQLCVSPHNFREHLQYLRSRYSVVPLSEIVHDLKAGTLTTGKVAITFDDGYADNLFNALPILEEFKVPATVFITTGNTESRQDFYWDTETPTEDRGRPMTIGEVRLLANHPLIEIGAHTVHHHELSHLAHEMQCEEIQESKITLEKILGKEIYSFAYPFGSKYAFSPETISAVQKSGFRFACANTQKHVYFFSNPFTLPRILVRNEDPHGLEVRLHI